MESLKALFNPASNQYHSYQDSKKLSAGKQALAWAAAVIVGLFTIGICSAAVFRTLVGRFSKDLPSKQSIDVTNDIRNISKNILVELQGKIETINLSKTNISVKQSQPLQLPPLVFEKEKPAATVKAPTTLEQDKQSKITESSFNILAKYISSKYRNFNIKDYTNIKELEAAGNPLHFGIVNKDKKLVELLLAAGANVNQVDKNGNNALMVVCERFDSVRSKIAEDLTPDERNQIEKEQNEWEEVFNLLIGKGSNILLRNNNKESPIERAVKSGLLTNKGLLEILKEKMTPENKDEFANLIHIKFYDKDRNAEINPKVVQLLIDRGIPVDFPDEAGRTPLYNAISTGHFELAELLIKNGAKMTLKKPAKFAKMGASSPYELLFQKIDELVVRRRVAASREGDFDKLKKFAKLVIMNAEQNYGKNDPRVQETRELIEGMIKL